MANENARMKTELEYARSKAKEVGQIAQNLLVEARSARQELEEANEQLAELGALTLAQMERRIDQANFELADVIAKKDRELAEIERERSILRIEADKAKSAIVETREVAILQEVGIYEFKHPLSDAVAYQSALKRLYDSIKTMAKKDGQAVLSITNWQVNGSLTEGRKMVREVSKLMLRAFNAEVEAIIADLKPFKRKAAIERLSKTAEVIRKLGVTMLIEISPAYLRLRMDEIELTSDFLEKQAEEKEIERRERERMREDRKAQMELERERAKLAKEMQHYSNALEVLRSKGDEEGAVRIEDQIAQVAKAIADVDYRAANVRAGYVYVVSNIGSFGADMIKVGMTRRLDPMDRIRELSDASVPFNFDVHALFFSTDAVSIETKMHEMLSPTRVNTVNRRREFFRATPADAKRHLTELAGELLQFDELPKALEYRQSMKMWGNSASS